MTRKVSSFSVLLWGMLLSLMSALPIGSAYAAQPQDPVAAERKLSEVTQRIRALGDRLGALQGKADDVQRKLRTAERSIGAIARRQHELAAQLAEQKRRIAGLGGEEKALLESIEDHKQALMAQVQAAYAMGRQAKLKMLLNQDDPASVSRTLVYYDYLNRARAQRLKGIQDDLQNLDKVRRRASWEQQRLAGLQKEAAEQKTRLESERETRKRLLVRLRNQLQLEGTRLAGLKKDQAQLQALLIALDQALADIPEKAGQKVSFKSRKGKLGWPIKGRRLAAFGQPRESGAPGWKGVLLAARRGGEVKAVHAGRVAYADWLRGMGLLIIIDHGDGYLSLYGHNESLYRQVGEWVDTGALIATAGDTGGLDKAAVYFELRRNGKPVDPVAWCRKDGKAAS